MTRTKKPKTVPHPDDLLLATPQANDPENPAVEVHQRTVNAARRKITAQLAGDDAAFLAASDESAKARIEAVKFGESLMRLLAGNRRSAETRTQDTEVRHRRWRQRAVEIKTLHPDMHINEIADVVAADKTANPENHAPNTIRHAISPALAEQSPSSK